MNKNIAIKAVDISKQYRLGEVGTGTISHDLNRFWAKLRGKEDPYLKIGESNDRSSKGDSDYVWSLRDINFEIEKGDAVGIIGRNGAGKSTLLKLLSRVTKPTTGHFEVNGRIASLLEVGTGFNPEMTGRENIFLNGAILGMRRHEIKSKFDEIVDFAGVERYIDTPVKRYSSGMYVRLAFAVAAHLESEILIVDEVLAVGDAEFQKKCLGKMGDVSKGEGRTVLFVSHNMAAVKKLCKKGILLNQGNLIESNFIEQITELYKSFNSEDKNHYINVDSSKSYYISHVQFANDQFEFFNHEDIEIAVKIDRTEAFVQQTFLLVRVLDQNEEPIFSSEIEVSEDQFDYQFVIKNNILVKGYYSLNLILYKPAIAVYDKISCCHFSVLNNNSNFSHLETFDIGKVYIPIEWKD